MEILIRLEEWLTLEELQRTMRLYDREWTPARTVVELSHLEQQGRVERTGEPPRFRRVDGRPGELRPREAEQRGNAVPRRARRRRDPRRGRGLEADLLLAVHRVFGDGWAIEVRRRFTEPGAIVIVTRSEPRAAGEDIAGDFVQFVVGEEVERLEGEEHEKALDAIAEHAKASMQNHPRQESADG